MCLKLSAEDAILTTCDLIIVNFQKEYNIECKMAVNGNIETVEKAMMEEEKVDATIEVNNINSKEIKSEVEDESKVDNINSKEINREVEDEENAYAILLEARGKQSLDELEKEALANIVEYYDDFDPEQYHVMTIQKISDIICNNVDKYVKELCIDPVIAIEKESDDLVEKHRIMAEEIKKLSGNIEKYKNDEIFQCFLNDFKKKKEVSKNSLSNNEISTPSCSREDTSVVVKKLATNLSSMASFSVVKHPAPLPPRPPSLPNATHPVPPRPSISLSREDGSIVIQWDLPVCHSKLKDFEIFGYMEEPDMVITTLLWNKIDTVRAMALPMACTVAKTIEGRKCHFAIRAVDIYGQCGSFSNCVSTL